MVPEDFATFMSGLDTAAPSLSTKALSRHISDSAPRLSRSLVNVLVNEIMTLEYLKQDSEMQPKEFASAISASALESASDEFKFTSEDAKTLNDRLFRIFSSDHVLELNTKAIAVITDHENLFYQAKILTDARPVFNDDGSKLEAMAIVHMLRIHFEHNQNHEDFFTALDSSDLKKLKAVIDRAERKAQVLQAMFKANNIVYLDVEQPNVDD
jgi:hypothetical protein